MLLLSKVPESLPVFLLLPVMALTTSGCPSAGLGGATGMVREDVEARTGDVFLPGVRARWELLPREGTLLAGSSTNDSLEDARDDASPRERWTLAVEGGYSSGSGDDTQSLGTNSFVRLDRTDLNGPAQVDIDYDLVHWYVGLRGGLLIDRRFEMSGILGAGFTNLDIDLEGPGSALRDSTDSSGLLVGGKLAWYFVPRLSVYGTASLSGTNDEQLTDYGLGVELFPLDGVSISAGWRWWQYEEERGVDSDIDLKLSGPTLELALTF